MKEEIKQESTEEASKKIQALWRARSSLREFEKKFGLNIQKASKDNIEKLRFSVGKLSEEERVLIGLMQENLKYSHATSYLETIEKAENKLLSLDVRKKWEEKTDNTHTSNKFGLNNYIYCTIEVGTNTYKAPSFLGDEIDIIKISPIEYKKEAGLNALDFAWIGTHFSEFENKSKSPEVIIGNTHYQISHHIDNSKTYKYTDKDGNITEKTIQFGEEVFFGDETIREALALQLIEHLRRLKNDEYIKYFYGKLTDKEIPEKENIDLIATTFNAFMPTTMYPELKIPGILSLKNKGINITREKEEKVVKKNTDRLKNLITFFSPTTIKEDSNIHKLKELIENVNEYTDNPKLLEFYKQFYEIDSNRHTKINDLEKFISDNEIISIIDDKKKQEILNLLGRKSRFFQKDTIKKLLDILVIKNGWDFIQMNNGSFYGSPLSCAIDQKNQYFLQYYLTTPLPDSLNPKIKRFISLNRRTGETEDPLAYAISTENIEIFNFLCKSGADISRFPHLLLYYTAKENKIEMLKNILMILENKKINMAELSEHPSALLELAKRGSKEGIKLLLKAGVKSTVRDSNRYEHYGFNLLHFLAENDALEFLKELVDDSLIDLKKLINEKAENGETPLSIARNEKYTKFETYLLKNGADEKNVLPTRPKYKKYKFHAAAIVIGYNNKKEEVVILGKKQSKANNGNMIYLVPGGLKDINDTDLIATAIREFEEETGYPLKEMMDKNKISPEIIFTYEDVIEGETLCRHVFVLIKLPFLLKPEEFKGDDDLLSVDVVPLSNIKIDNNVIKNEKYYVQDGDKITPLLVSNGFLLEAIIGNLKENSKELNKFSENQKKDLFFLMQVENSSKELIKKAVMENDINRIKQLQAYNVSLNQIYYFFPDRVDSLLDLAFKSCTWETIAYLNNNGAKSEKPHFQAIMSDMIENNVFAMEIIKDNPDIFLANSGSFIQALTSAIKKGHLELIKFIVDNYCKETSDNLLNALTPLDTTFLRLAIKFGNIDVVHELIKLGAKVNPDAAEYTPLIDSIIQNKLDIFFLLMKNGADINAILEIKSENQNSEQESRVAEFKYLTNQITNEEYLDISLRNMKCVGIKEDRKVCPFYLAVKYERNKMAKKLYESMALEDKKAVEEIFNMNRGGSQTLKNWIEDYGNKNMGSEKSDEDEEKDEIDYYFEDPMNGKKEYRSFTLN
jgi:ankyrin repeat protein/8-oxo-dGTP pyrophosphatase MutT (NUDIX family)